MEQFFNKQSDNIFFFQFFLGFWKYCLKKIKGYNRKTVSSNNRTTLGWHTEFYYKKISEIRNIRFIFQNFEKKFQKRKKNVKMSMDSEK